MGPAGWTSNLLLPQSSRGDCSKCLSPLSTSQVQTFNCLPAITVLSQERSHRVLNKTPSSPALLSIPVLPVHQYHHHPPTPPVRNLGPPPSCTSPHPTHHQGLTSPPFKCLKLTHSLHRQYHGCNTSCCHQLSLDPGNLVIVPHVLPWYSSVGPHMVACAIISKCHSWGCLGGSGH